MHTSSGLCAALAAVTDTNLPRDLVTHGVPGSTESEKEKAAASKASQIPIDPALTSFPSHSTNASSSGASGVGVKEESAPPAVRTGPIPPIPLHLVPPEEESGNAGKSTQEVPAKVSIDFTIEIAVNEEGKAEKSQASGDKSDK